MVSTHTTSLCRCNIGVCSHCLSSFYQLDGLKLTFKKNRKKRKKEAGLCVDKSVCSCLVLHRLN